MKQSINTALHRPTVCDDEYEDACAQEGLIRAANASADAPELYEPPVKEPLVKAPRVPRDTKAISWVVPVIGAISLSAVAIVCYVAMVAA